VGSKLHSTKRFLQTGTLTMGKQALGYLIGTQQANRDPGDGAIQDPESA
jgi:hypothetical protein